MLRKFFFQEFLSTLGINMQKKTLNAILYIYICDQIIILRSKNRNIFL